MHPHAAEHIRQLRSLVSYFSNEISVVLNPHCLKNITKKMRSYTLPHRTNKNDFRWNICFVEKTEKKTYEEYGGEFTMGRIWKNGGFTRYCDEHVHKSYCSVKTMQSLNHMFMIFALLRCANASSFPIRLGHFCARKCTRTDNLAPNVWMHSAFTFTMLVSFSEFMVYLSTLQRTSTFPQTHTHMHTKIAEQ